MAYGNANVYSWNNSPVYSHGIYFIANSSISEYYFKVIGLDTNTHCKTRVDVTVYVDPCITNIEKIREQRLLKIYPNPTKNYFFIETENQVDVEIYNQLGQLVFKNNFESGKYEMRLSGLASGLYFLHTKSKDGLHILKLIRED